MNKLLLFLCFVFVIFLDVVRGAWVPAKFTITSDNAYAVYTGSSSGVTYLGSEWASSAADILSAPEYYPVGPLGKNDPTPPATPLYLDTTQAVYIVAWSDAFQYQGILFDFVINGVQISPNNPAWEVYPTNFFPQPVGVPTYTTAACTPPQPPPYDRGGLQFGQYITMPPCPTWVAQQIALADASSGWQTPTRGDDNNAASLWGSAATGLPATSKWMWYDSQYCDPSTNRPFDAPNGCHHAEPLIFKLPANAWINDPDSCKPKVNGQKKYCTGQCPFRADGTSPLCTSVFSATGDLRGCDCCRQCELVVQAPKLEDSYCVGTCPGCQECLPASYGSYIPDPTTQLPVKYPTSCRCQQQTTTELCHVDRCNNKCVGQCPSTGSLCEPSDIDPATNQIRSCNCTIPEQFCHPEISQTTGETICSGKCKVSDSECKAVFTNGQVTGCSCDCCDLVKDATGDPRGNKCVGKCDKVPNKCEPAMFETYYHDGQPFDVIAECACH